MKKFLNLDTTKSALNVPSDVTWEECNDVINIRWSDRDRAFSTGPYLASLLDTGLPVLMYAGDYDYICNYLGNKAVALGMEWEKKEEFGSAADRTRGHRDRQRRVIAEPSLVELLRVAPHRAVGRDLHDSPRWHAHVPSVNSGQAPMARREVRRFWLLQHDQALKSRLPSCVGRLQVRSTHVHKRLLCVNGTRTLAWGMHLVSPPSNAHLVVGSAATHARSLARVARADTASAARMSSKCTPQNRRTAFSFAKLALRILPGAGTVIKGERRRVRRQKIATPPLLRLGGK